MIWLGLGAVSTLLSLVANPSKPVFLFGLPVSAPYSILVLTALLSIDFYVMIQLIRGVAWRMVLSLLGLKILNFLAGGFLLLSTPLSHLSTAQARLIVLVPMLTGIGIGVVAWAYLFKLRNHFAQSPGP